MTEEEAQRSADLADRVAQRWGERPDEFHVVALGFFGEEGRTLYGLAKSFGGPIVEWTPTAELVTAFTGEKRERCSHGDMVRKVAP